MFTQIVTAFQGFFSRAFWFGSFLPVAVAVSLHLALLHLVFPDALPLGEWLAMDASTTALGFTLLIAALVVIAYASIPFPPLIRGFLQGRYMPNWLHDALRRDRVPAWRAAREKNLKAQNDANTFDLLLKGLQDIWQAAQVGDALKAVPDPKLIEKAAEAVQAWEAEVARMQLPSAEAACGARKSVLEALRANSSSWMTIDLQGKALEHAKRLDDTKRRLIDLIHAAKDEADYRFARVAGAHSPAHLHSTRLGDACWRTEAYSKAAYHVSFEYIWPRIQLLLKREGNADFMQRLEDASAQLDFAVLLLLLATSVPLVWLPLISWTGGSPWLFLVIGLLAPIVLTFLYELVVQTENVFGQVVCVAIDRYRLDVLTDMLRQPKPATLAAERALWETLERSIEIGNAQDLSFRHPSAS